MFLRSRNAAKSLPVGAERLRGLELSPIKEVELRASRVPGVISLAQGIPSFDTPEAIKRYAQRMMQDGACAKYSVTPGLPQLREAIAEALARDGMYYDPDDEIIVTAGSIEAISATLLALIDPGDEVLVVSPTYASYLPAIRIAGGVPRFVPLDEDANFDLDPDAIAAAAGRRTRALLLCNPNNPTGTVFSRAQTLRMLEVAERHDLLVISDEVYKDFLYGDARIFSAAMEPAARHRVIRVFSFSKAYGMTGWRVGFVHGPAPHMAEVLKVHDALVTCAPVVSQYGALAALELGEESIAGFRAEFRRRRDRVIERLDALSAVLDYQKPNASYFVFPRVKDTVPFARDSRRLAAEILEKARVALVPGFAFGPTGEAHLRLCYARPPDDVEAAFDRLTEYFAGRLATAGTAPAIRIPPPRPPAADGRGAFAPRALPFTRRAGVRVLRGLARHYARRRRPKIVAITGTQGKTVMKRALHELLSSRYRVRSNPLSHNTEVGLPLAVLDVEMDARSPARIARGFAAAAWNVLVDREPIDVLVLELGVRRRGDMRAHLDVLRPDVAVVMPLAPGLSSDHEALAVLRAEIEELCAAPGRPPALFVCGDDPLLAELAERTPGCQVFGRRAVTGRNGALELHVGEQTFPVTRDTVGASSLYALEVAVRVGQLLEVAPAAIENFLRR